MTVMIFMLGACESFSSDDVPATLAIEQTAYATEVVLIQATIQAAQIESAQTVQAAEVQATQISGVNRLLLATVRANQPPTVERVPAILDESSVESQMEDSMPGENGGATTSGSMQVRDVATARSVRQADGCAVSTQSQFPANTSRVYLTARVDNLQAGTQFSVEWRYYDEIIDRSEWTANEGSDSLCIWFYTDGPFDTGDWSATLYVNGSQIQPVATYTVP